MALYRETPKCPYCDEIIAKAVYKKPDNNFIGDTFLYWDYLKHDCKNKPQLSSQQLKEAEKEIENLSNE